MGAIESSDHQNDGDGEVEWIVHGTVPSQPPTSWSQNGQQYPRVLCLHGKGSSNAVTAMQVMHIGLDRLASCDCLRAPVASPAYSEVFEEFFGGRFWQWHQPAGVGRSPTWASVEPSLRRVLRHIEREGPYDGVFGFSQGAGIATLLSSPSVLKALGVESCKPPWRFAILACGADTAKGIILSHDASTADETAHDLIQIPSLHIIGKFDMIRWWSTSLADKYATSGSTTYWTNTGHELPMSLLRDDEMRNTLERFLQAAGNPDDAR